MGWLDDIYDTITGRSVQRKLDQILSNEVTIMSALDDVKATLADIGKDLDEIDGDIDELIAKLPASGGMSAAEVAELKTLLDGVKTHTREAADKVPEPPTP